MQCAVIEFARNACELEGAHSAEFLPESPHPVISLMTEQEAVTQMGGTMRLGAYPCVIAPGTRAAEAYGRDRVDERHRHRFELNSAYRERLEKKGLVCSGVSPDNRLVEMVELRDHPWFVACQFHPEFKSKPVKAHPLFVAFVRSALEKAPGQPDFEGGLA
jgi:CTP synthase